MLVEQYIFVVNRYADAIEKAMNTLTFLVVSLVVIIVVCFIGIVSVMIRDCCLREGMRVCKEQRYEEHY